MWTKDSCLTKAKENSDGFIPPYCARPRCPWHYPSAVPRENAFPKFGVNKIRRWPYFNQRYLCRKCGGTFVQSFFTLSYRDKWNDTYEQIHDSLLMGASGRAIAKKLKMDEDTVRRRKKKLARWGILAMAQDQARFKIKESVAYDGLENFAYSQYDPNNLNHAVGRDSLYVYDFNLSPLNRKGKTSPYQKAKLKKLDEAHGRYDSSAVQKDSRKIFARLLKRTHGDLHLHTDKHKAYRRAIGSLEDRNRIVHATTSSKLARNFRNRLFAINHTDMLTRHQTGNFKRETISFARNTVAMLETFILLVTHKNYLRPRFLKKHKRDPKAHLESPAMALSLRAGIQTFSEFYRTRISVHHVELNDDWQNYFRSTDPRSRRMIRAYPGI